MERFEMWWAILLEGRPSKSDFKIQIYVVNFGRKCRRLGFLPPTPKPDGLSTWDQF